MNPLPYHDFVTQSFGPFLKERGNEPAWLRSLREEVFGRFEATGFPTTRQEEWRYTSIDPVMKGFFHSPLSSNGFSKRDLERWRGNQSGGLMAVFVNGRFSQGLSSLAPLPPGAIVTPFCSLLATDPERLATVLGKKGSFQNCPGGSPPWVNHPFVALNTAFFEDGLYVYLPKGGDLISPLRVLFLSSERGIVSYPRLLIEAAEGSRASLMEIYAGVEHSPQEGGITSPSLTNAVTEIILHGNASLEQVKIQQENCHAFHLAAVQVAQHRSSQWTSHSFSLGGALCRNDLHTTLGEAGSESSLNGLYLADGTQRVDNHTCVEHAGPHATSRELYKGILTDQAQGVFNGKIVVRPGAQKTDASQTNKNLLLSEEAVINTKPELEIEANDVKCSHGATIGQLDEEAVFYCRSRGIGDREARSFLAHAFADEMIDRIQTASLRQELPLLVQEKMRSLHLSEPEESR